VNEVVFGHAAVGVTLQQVAQAGQDGLPSGQVL
jgi:hypothetical protein